MSEEPTQFISQDKLDELQKEWKEIKEVKIPALAQRIDDARQLGDLSENAEYHAAREEMSWTQSRLKQLAAILQNTQLISGQKTKAGIIGVGSTIVVKVKGVKKEYTIVGAQEADPLKGKISNESPLGQAFLGKKKGEVVEVTVPAGVQMYEIVEVE